MKDFKNGRGLAARGPAAEANTALAQAKGVCLFAVSRRTEGN